MSQQSDRQAASISTRGSGTPVVGVGASVEVTAPSRLHFGLLGFGASTDRQFGGVGVMIKRPAVRMRLKQAERFQAIGPRAERIREFARRWIEFHGVRSHPSCRIEVISAPPQHVGLGAGTQLGLSVAAGLGAICGLPAASPVELAVSVGRGLRSAVGTYGFVRGGLVVERGKTSLETLAPLDLRLDLPSAWRFVLIQPVRDAGLSGSEEQQAFAQLPAVPRRTTAQLIDLVRNKIVPAAAAARFDDFSEGVYQYGHLAGMCFSAVQGGPYNGRRLTELVREVRQLGVAGVGQSSWGPTLFAVLPDEGEARRFVDSISGTSTGQDAHYTVTAVSNSGAMLRSENQLDILPVQSD
jgi:beta-RFAP synthase